MKKIYPVLILLVILGFNAGAQSLQLQNANLYHAGDPNTLLDSHVDVYNAAPNALNVEVEEKNTVEIAPILDLTPDTDLEVNGAFGFRYFFE